MSDIRTTYSYDQSGRIAVVVIFVVLITIIIILRLAAVQLLDIYHLRGRADNQGMISETVLPERGLILDRNNKILATNVITYDLGTRYADLIEPEKALWILGKTFNTPTSVYRKKLENRKSFTYLQKNVAPYLADSLKQIRALRGINFERKMSRIYPYKSAASQLIGFVSYDHQGQSGIERAYNEVLQGLTGSRTVRRDQRGNVVSFENINTRESVSGGDVKLTIDIEYQSILEDELAYAVKKNKAKSGIGIIMDPQSGQVLAMANYPGFDPNLVSSSKAENRRNRVIADQFEPGSIFKIVPAAIAIDRGVLSKDSRVFCENGSWKVKDRTIHDTEEHGWLSLEEVMIYSSNIGAGKIAEQTGNRPIYETARTFGFGEATHIGLPEEADGSLRPLNEWSGIDFSQIAMGHGISTTLLQMAMAYSSIANGGILLKPFVVQNAYNRHHKKIEENETTLIRRVIKKETAGTLCGILEKVVLEGTGKNAYINGYHVAGKTGTAQKFIDRKYSNSKYYASFMGFFPANNPVLVCGIAINEPAAGRHYGSVSAAPAVRKVFNGIINTTKFDETYEKMLKKRKDNTAVPLSIRRSAGNNIPVSLKKEFENDNELPDLSNRRNLSENNIVMPDLTGFPVKYAIYKLENLGLEIKTPSDRGVVRSQDPLPGTYINENTICRLTVTL